MPDASRDVPRRPRPHSVVVLLVLVAASAGAALVAGSVVRDQGRRLLRQRAVDAETVVTQGLQSVRGQLAAIGSELARSDDPAAFDRAAGVLVRLNPATAAVALVDTTGQPRVVALQRNRALRTTLSPGPLTGEPALAVRRAVEADRRLQAAADSAAAQQAEGSLAATPMMPVRGGRLLALALAAPVLPPHTVLVVESFSLPPQPVRARSAFSEIDAAVYATDRVDPGQLLLTTVPAARLPLHAPVATAHIDVGYGGLGGRWLLVARPTAPLAGSLATAMPWILGVGGALLSLAVAAMVEVLMRRRRYAERLVAERTAELRESLAALARTQDRLVRGERLAAVGQLAAAVGHELRSPLGVIANVLYLVRARLGPQGDEAVLRHLATADREVTAASLIVSDLLDYARQREPLRMRCDARELVHDALVAVPAPPGVTVRVDEPTGPVELRADREQLRQVMLNLVLNAVQAMPDGGELTVRVASGDGRVRLSVADTGPGVPAESRDRLFEPFYTTKVRGIGLGLAVTRRLVQAHGGEITVHGAVPRGAVFVVTLPQGRAEPASADRARTAAAST